MKIKVEFDNEWTVEEVKEYLSDMDNERYQDLYDDKQLELAACAYMYCVDNENNQKEMNDIASEDIAVGIDEFFFTEMCRNYIDAYQLDVACRKAYCCQKQCFCLQ